LQSKGEPSSLTSLFADKIKIPLRNPQWSWGVYDNENQRVILRVWEDEIETDSTGEYVWILDETRAYSSNEFSERKDHISKLREGVSGFGIVCEPKPNASGGRSMKKFYDEQAVKFGEIFEKEGRTYARLAEWVPLYSLFRTESWQHNIPKDLAEISKDKSISESTREQLIQARVGQGQFRSGVLAMWGNQCAVSGVESTEIIRASHVKPWRHSTNEERLDPNNGLPLIATFDALFDRLLISFDDSGSLLVSSLVIDSDREKLGLNGIKGLRKAPGNVLLPYLRWHQGSFMERTGESRKQATTSLTEVHVPAD